MQRGSHFLNGELLRTLVYIGHIGETLDFHLIEKLAKENLTLLFAGPVRHGAFFEILREYATVVWVGEQEHEKAFRLMGLADVGIIPFRKSELTAYVTPNKAYEYASMKLPVVATNVFLDHSEFDFVHFAESHDEFRSLVKTVQYRETDLTRFGWGEKAKAYENLIQDKIRLGMVRSTPFPI